MGKLTIGQKVRVKENFCELPNPTGVVILGEKKKLAGKVLEVEYISENGNILTKQGTLGDNIDTWFVWHPSWLEPVDKVVCDYQVGGESRLTVFSDESTYIKSKVEKTLETLEKEDILVNSDGDYRKVLSVLEEGELYAMSIYSKDLQSDNLKVAGGNYSLFDLQNLGFKPYIPETEVEITIKKISKALDKTVKVVE